MSAISSSLFQELGDQRELTTAIGRSFFRAPTPHLFQFDALSTSIPPVIAVLQPVVVMARYLSGELKNIPVLQPTI